MSKSNSHQKKSNQSDPKIGKTIISDFRNENIPRSLIQELKDIYHFYIDYEHKKRLAQMGKTSRWLRIGWWILKSMFYKLTPVRRILFFLGLILTFVYTSNNTDKKFIIGILLIIIVLMLELKDRLLAKDELLAGKAVQTALMPRQNPKIPGWDIWLYTRPANEVGGDLVDYVKLAEQKWGIILGDVSGKGLGAALLMAKLQATIRALAPGTKSLRQLGDNLNEIFCRDSIPDRFVTMVFLQITAFADQINILNAGHMPPLIFSGNRITEIPHGNLALGIDAKASYKSQNCELKKDGLLVVYSDGVTEARNKTDDFFGEAKLKNFLSENRGSSCTELGKKLLSKIDVFVNDERQSDDLSLILLKRI